MDILELLNQDTFTNSSDDQLFFTKQFLNDDIRTGLKIKLDSRSAIFQNLNGATGEVEM